MISFICSYSSIRIWDVHTGKLKHILTGHTEEVEVITEIHEYGVTCDY